ncbi:hypothetical protein MA16_Dca024288 [Dendrobium catenatum]|uniref:Uncharacterized protein n=1 Tax=Dendrobium catenatum TaxID=906689 RepID=A0A2I0VRQ3_9ASPA|nr:hypothetical protein MA16_Dca024288 [Dendrobium catenatum]
MKDIMECSGKPGSKCCDEKHPNTLEAGSFNHGDEESTYGPWLQVNYKKKGRRFGSGRLNQFPKRVYVPKQNSILSEKDRSIPDNVVIPAQENSVQIEVVREAPVEAVDCPVSHDSHPELPQVLAPISFIPSTNKFGILSELNDNNLNCYEEEIHGIGVEEGEITYLEQLITVNSQEQDLKIITEESCKGTSQEIKEVEFSSSEKKGKLLKELKSLGSGNIVNYNRKVEVGRSKKGGGLPH